MQYKPLEFSSTLFTVPCWILAHYWLTIIRRFMMTGSSFRMREAAQGYTVETLLVTIARLGKGTSKGTSKPAVSEQVLFYFRQQPIYQKKETVEQNQTKSNRIKLPVGGGNGL